jgi:hypothetical protein
MSPRKPRSCLLPRLSRTTLRHPKNKLNIAQRERGDAFFDIQGGRARLRSYPRKANESPSRCWEKGTSWVSGGVRFSLCASLLPPQR